MDSPNLQRALRLKTNANRGGALENVYFRNVEIGRVSHSVLTIDLVYGRITDGPFPPIVRNVVMENVTVTSCPRVLSVVGTAKSVIEGVRVANCAFRGVEGADILTNSGAVCYQNVTVEPATVRPPTVAPARAHEAAPGKTPAVPVPVLPSQD